MNKTNKLSINIPKLDKVTLSSSVEDKKELDKTVFDSIKNSTSNNNIDFNSSFSNKETEHLDLDYMANNSSVKKNKNQNSKTSDKNFITNMTKLFKNKNIITSADVDIMKKYCEKKDFLNLSKSLNTISRYTKNKKLRRIANKIKKGDEKSLDVIYEALKKVSLGYTYLYDIYTEKNERKITVKDLVKIDQSIRIQNAKYTQTIDDIVFKSETNDGLKQLVDYYMGLKEQYNNPQALSFIEGLREVNMIITDIGSETDGYNDAYCRSGDYLYGKNLTGFIYLGGQTIKNKSYSTFFHEAGHFKDYLSNFFEIGIEGVTAAKSVISSDINFKLVANEFKRVEKECERQILRMEKTILKKARKKIKRQIKDYNNYNKFQKHQILSYYYAMIRDDEMDKLLRKNPIVSVADICDSITEGKFSESYGTSGHGIKYYKDNIRRQSTEIIANFSDLYNNGFEYELDKYFPIEFREKLTETYQEISTLSDIDYVKANNGGE